MDEQAARAAIERAVARPLGLTLEAAAEGVIRIANANMSRAIRSVSTERGYDLAQFALFAYGGAGPLHATEIAAECGIPTVVVPQEPGTLCARGMLLTDISFDFVRSELAGLDAGELARACASSSRRWRPRRARGSSASASPPPTARSAATWTRATRARTSK